MLLMKLSLFLFAAAMTLPEAASANKHLPPPQAKPNCTERCGTLTIPYPFGIGDGCYIPLKGQEPQFNLSCDNSTEPPSLNWTSSNIGITEFLLDQGKLQVWNFKSKDCYNELDRSMEPNGDTYINWYPPFSISGVNNSLFAIGCDTSAVLKGFRGNDMLVTGCMSVCLNISTVDKKSCSGVGCCQTKIPEGLNNFNLSLGSYNNHRGVYDFNPCSYAFIAKNDYFKFNGTSSFKQIEMLNRLPMIVNWQIGSETCQVAEKNPEDYACKGNTTCVNQSEGPYNGYYCRCSEGYEGNPYIGCRDIDECLAGTDPCGNGTCQNSLGSYSCKCKKGFRNEGPQKCIAHSRPNDTLLKVLLGISAGLFVLLLVVFGLYRDCKRTQIQKLKAKYFDKNGGPKLDQYIKQEGKNTVEIFCEKDIMKATNNFDEKIGEGGYGIVYKGELRGRKVAIKASKMTTSAGSDQFINEVIVLSQIKHKNVVKLIGCCLETEKPILVYEFIHNGTLHDRIHKKEGQPLSFAQRLKIAKDTASALAYLHCGVSDTQPIVHRDIKATNILLDVNLIAKVSDFGASKLVSDDKNQLTTLVQGTMGYLDPEYLQSNKLTEKSDVYSFGVVLVELLTSQTACRSDNPEAEEGTLAYVFLSTMEKKTPLDAILDPELVKDGNREVIQKVAELAHRCLSVKGDARPTMKVVERELDEMHKTLTGQPFASCSKIDLSLESQSNRNNVVPSDEGEGGSTGITRSAEYDASMQEQAQKPSGYGR